MRCFIVLLVSFFTIHTGLYSQSVKPVVLVSGKVLNERTMRPVGAKVIYEILPEGKQAGVARSNPKTGDYKIILPKGKHYSYMALAEGYYSVTKNMDASGLRSYTEIEEQNLYLAPVMKDQVVRLNNVFFGDNTAEITEASYPELDRFVAFLKVNKKIEIEISGHTDSFGNPDDKMFLSKQRAQAVVDYLISEGVKERRLTAKGFGMTRPMGFNNSPEGRKMNNRIEFKVLSLTKTK